MTAALGAVAFTLRNNSQVHDEEDWTIEEVSGANIESMFDDNMPPQNDIEKEGDENPIDSDLIPEGWTEEQFTAWIEGPTPEGWTEEQWVDFVSEQNAKLASHGIQTEG